jgi:hypothetical protein
MSVDASGKFGGSMVFSKWKGRNYARKLVVPANPKAAKQTGVRAMLTFLAKNWAALSAGIKDDYDTLAAAAQISAFNAYVGANLERWQANQGPSQAYPALDASTPIAITSAPLTGHEGYVTAVVTPAANANINGIMVWRDSVSLTPTWANCVAVYFQAAVAVHTFTDSPLPAATYHYRFAQFNKDGIIGTILADASCVVT